MRPYLALTLVLAVVPVARAETVTLQFSGHVTNLIDHETQPPLDPGFIWSGGYPPLPISVGDPFTVTYSYDATVRADPLFSSYDHQTFFFDRNHPIAMSISVGSETYSPDGNLDEPFSSSASADAYSYLGLNTNQPALPASYYLHMSDSDHRSAEFGFSTDVALSESGTLSDAPIPSLPLLGGFLDFTPNPTRLISESYVVDGIVEGGIPIFQIDPITHMRVQTKTQFLAVYMPGDTIQGKVTSFSVVPEPQGPILTLLGLAGLASRRRASTVPS